MIKEYELLKSLDHPHIVRLLEVYKDEENFLLVTELCQGADMIEEMETRETFSEKDASSIIK